MGSGQVLKIRSLISSTAQTDAMVLTPPLWSVLGTKTAIGVPRVTPARSRERQESNPHVIRSLHQKILSAGPIPRLHVGR